MVGWTWSIPQHESLTKGAAVTLCRGCGVGMVAAGGEEVVGEHKKGETGTGDGGEEEIRKWGKEMFEMRVMIMTQ